MFKWNNNILNADMSMADPTIWWRGFPRSGGYAYSVIIGFLGSYPNPGWQHHGNTMSVYTAI